MTTDKEDVDFHNFLKCNGSSNTPTSKASVPVRDPNGQPTNVASAAEPKPAPRK